MNFWDKLVKRGMVVGLSPMDGVTDAPMRYMTAKYGRPDVLFTEFVSVDAIHHAKNPEAVDRLMKAFIRAQDVGSLEVKPYEVAQVFGHTPELFYQAAIIIATLGFDGLDINMGCPAPNVQERGSGAGLIRTPELAQEIVREAKRGMKDWENGKVTVKDLEVSEAVKEWGARHTVVRKEKAALPVSVKTRIGVEKDVAEEWMSLLMKVKPDMISLHGRTLKQLYQGTADWEAIGRAARIVHSLGGRILGNGDISSIEDLKNKVKEYGVDGGLIGRAAEGSPGIFAGINEPSWEQRKGWMLEHAEIYELTNKPLNQSTIVNRNWFLPMRKHLAWYCKGFAGASELRERLVRVGSCAELALINI